MPVQAEEPKVTLGIDRLADETEDVYWDRLFMQCASWTAYYGDVSQPAKEKLMELGVPPLLHLVPTWLGDNDIRHRVTLEEIIVKVGPDAAVSLLPYVGDPNAVLRQRCVVVLGDMDRPDVLPALTPRLPLETDILVLPSLIEGIGKRGAGHADLVPALAPFLQKDDERLRRNAAVALGRIGVGDAIPVLLPLLDDRFFSVRQPATEAVWKLAQSSEDLLEPYPDQTTIAGQALRRELVTAETLLLGGKIDTSEWTSVANDLGPPEIVSATLRGIWRAWQINHVGVEPYYDSLPSKAADPRVDAVLREILAAKSAQEAKEAKEAKEAAAAPKE
ncbi:MAG: HEAT repeat domain-containing protein [bacterium]